MKQKSRGRISTYERAPTAGSVSLDPSRKAIWWGLGERITSQNLEVALPATVTFDGVIDPSESEDAFCSNDTGYIEVLPSPSRYRYTIHWGSNTSSYRVCRTAYRYTSRSTNIVPVV